MTSIAKYVTISCIGPRPLVVDASVSPEETVNLMIEHWRKQLDNVLPDRPDLIVLPEACDRPDVTRYPLKERLAYYRTRGNRFRDFLADVARQHRCYITYPAHTEAADGSWRNAM